MAPQHPRRGHGQHLYQEKYQQAQAGNFETSLHNHRPHPGPPGSQYPTSELSFSGYRTGSQSQQDCTSQHDRTISNVSATAPSGCAPTLERTTTIRPGQQEPLPTFSFPPTSNKSWKSNIAHNPSWNADTSPLNFPRPGSRPGRISPADLSMFTQRAAARNAPKSSISKVNTSSRDSPTPHNPFAILSPLPQQLPHRASNQKNEIFASPFDSSKSERSAGHNDYQTAPAEYFGLSDTPRAPRALRVREIQRGIGYHTGLDANMPSQIPRNQQEADAAARQHADRVRNMQRSLASDPNVLMPRLPGAPRQLTAIGPPLTGDPQTAQALPSVLQPKTVVPSMTYEQSIRAICTETGPHLLSLSISKSQDVSCVLYGPSGSLLTVAEGLVLRHDCNLEKTIMLIQEVVDNVVSPSHPAHDGSRYLVKTIDIRNAIKESNPNYPALKGVSIGGDEEQWAMWVRWIIRGDMETYWEAYRTMLQTHSAKPIFKIICVRQVEDSGCPQGHEFTDVSENANHAPEIAVYDTDAHYTAGGAYNGESSGSFNQGDYQHESSQKTAAKYESDGGSDETLNTQNVNQTYFEDDATVSDGQTHGSEDFRGGVGSHQMITPDMQAEIDGLLRMKEERSGKAKEVDPTKNWGYYQRMGGDPANWEKYDLSHVPFDVDPSNPPPQRTVFTEPEDLKAIDAINQAFESQGPGGTRGPTVSEGPAPWTELEKEINKVHQQQQDNARGFEDDDEFFPNADIQFPTRDEMIAARKITPPKIGKGKAKEQVDDHVRSMLGSSVPMDANKYTLPYLMPNYREATTPGGVVPSPRLELRGRSPLTKASSTMNVHATPFHTNTPHQNTSLLSPFAPSQNSGQPSYMQTGQRWKGGDQEAFVNAFQQARMTGHSSSSPILRNPATFNEATGTYDPPTFSAVRPYNNFDASSSSNYAQAASRAAGNLNTFKVASSSTQPILQAAGKGASKKSSPAPTTFQPADPVGGMPAPAPARLPTGLSGTFNAAGTAYQMTRAEADEFLKYDIFGNLKGPVVLALGEVPRRSVFADFIPEIGVSRKVYPESSSYTTQTAANVPHASTPGRNNGLLAALRALRPMDKDGQVAATGGALSKDDQALADSQLPSGGNAGGLSHIGGEGKFGTGDIAAKTGGDGAAPMHSFRAGGPLSVLDDPAFTPAFRGSFLTGGQAPTEESTRSKVHADKTAWIYGPKKSPAKKRVLRVRKF